MKIVVFGANGRVGRRFVEYALEEGHEIRAVVRDPNTFPFAKTRKVTVVTGNALAAVVCETACRTGQVVVSAIGNEITDQATSVRADATRQILHGMKVHAVPRLLLVSSADILPFKPGVTRMEHFLNPSERHVGDDHRRAWEAVVEAGVDYTRACPSYMPNGLRMRQYRRKVEGLPDGGRQVSVEDVADFLIEALASSEFNKTRVGLAY
jgi:putative NADH-flavin reductase